MMGEYLEPRCDGRTNQGRCIFGKSSPHDRHRGVNEYMIPTSAHKDAVIEWLHLTDIFTKKFFEPGGAYHG